MLAVESVISARPDDPKFLSLIIVVIQSWTCTLKMCSHVYLRLEIRKSSFVSLVPFISSRIQWEACGGPTISRSAFSWFDISAAHWPQCRAPAAGEATPAALAHAMGNTLSASNALFATYCPVNLTSLRDVMEARRRGRRKLR